MYWWSLSDFWFIRLRDRVTCRNGSVFQTPALRVDQMIQSYSSLDISFHDSLPLPPYYPHLICRERFRFPVYKDELQVPIKSNLLGLFTLHHSYNQDKKGINQLALSVKEIFCSTYSQLRQSFIFSGGDGNQ